MMTPKRELARDDGDFHRNETELFFRGALQVRRNNERGRLDLGSLRLSPASCDP